MKLWESILPLSGIPSNSCVVLDDIVEHYHQMDTFEFLLNFLRSFGHDHIVHQRAVILFHLQLSIITGICLSGFALIMSKLCLLIIPSYLFYVCLFPDHDLMFGYQITNRVPVVLIVMSFLTAMLVQGADFSYVHRNCDAVKHWYFTI